MTLAHESLRCPGMHDLSPEEMERFRRIEQVFRSVCTAWGFREVRTPVIEHLHLFTSAGTLSPQMLGRVYSFLDWDGWSGERVVLRPDATIPAARLYWERYRGQLAKLFYVENIFRFAPSEDRREIWQCGAELIGDSWPLGDLEVIAIVRGILEQLGFAGPALRLSHTGIIRAILSTAGYPQEQELALYDRLIEGDLTVFAELEGRLPQAAAPLSMLRDLTGGQVEGLENLRSALAATLPGIVQPIEELRTVAMALKAAGWPYVLDLTIVRGFEYYTGPVFHLLIDGQNVAGGGRYDGLAASQEGHSVPACGFAISVEPLMALLGEEPNAAPEMIDVVPGDQSAERTTRALAVVTGLHAAGYRAELVTAGWDAAGRWQLTLGERAGKLHFWLQDRSTGVALETDAIEELHQALAGGAQA